MAKTAAQARQSMGLAITKYTITVLGGSQGSQSLNHAVLQLIADKNFPASDVQFIHQTGTNEVEKVKAAYQKDRSVLMCLTTRLSWLTCTQQPILLLHERGGNDF